MGSWATAGALWALTLDSENERLAGEEGGIEALVAIICKEDASDALLEKVRSNTRHRLPIALRAFFLTDFEFILR